MHFSYFMYNSITLLTICCISRLGKYLKFEYQITSFNIYQGYIVGVIILELMDYMNLGITSRKTGLRVKEHIQKDEYSMENVDDFFQDDEESFINARRKSRKSSILPNMNSINNNKLSQLSIPFSQRPNKQNLNSQFSPDQYDASSQVQVEGTPNLIHRFNNHHQDNIPSLYNDVVYDESGPPMHPNYKEHAERVYFSGSDDLQENSIKLTPQRDNVSNYKDIPDLVNDEETTRDNTSFNTSDHGLPDDELEDDFEINSEQEDGEYVDDELVSDGETSIIDSDSSSSSGSDLDHKIPVSKGNIPENQKKNYVETSSDIYDSDDEYIQTQGQELLNETSSLPCNGLRKSHRVKFAPLEYWRNEKVIYKRKSEKPILEIDQIITYDYDQDEEEELLQKKKHTAKTRARPYNYIPTGRPRGRPRKNPLESNIRDQNLNVNKEIINKTISGEIPNSEWIKHGILQGKVKTANNDYESNEIIAFAPNLAQSEQIRDNEDDKFTLAIMFDKYRDQFASGMLKLPVDGYKSINDSYNAFITFYTVQGVVEVTLGDKKFLCMEGSSFQIPAFNSYAFINKGNNEAKIFFVQVTVPENFNTNFEEDNKVEELDSKYESDARSSSRMSLIEP